MDENDFNRMRNEMSMEEKMQILEIAQKYAAQAPEAVMEAGRLSRLEIYPDGEPENPFEPQKILEMIAHPSFKRLQRILGMEPDEQIMEVEMWKLEIENRGKA